MPFGRAPALEVDGTMIAGSINILKYLGAKFGETICMSIDDDDNSIAYEHVANATVTKLNCMNFHRLPCNLSYRFNFIYFS